MSDHTPGPWIHKKYYGDNHIEKANGESIMADPSYYPFIDINDADWKLIAAAPDLLEALEDFIQWRDSGCDYETVHSVAIKARAAIAKATGAE